YNSLYFGTASDLTTENLKLPKFENDLKFEDNPSINSLMSVDEGIEFHRNEYYESAWKCFEKIQNFVIH
ncbi:5719_t:CDS:1, partial [Dentiscutata erythropus]